jgi:hypothetical protein
VKGRGLEGNLRMDFAQVPGGGDGDGGDAESLDTLEPSSVKKRLT